jgi:hypothetical protein
MRVLLDTCVLSELRRPKGQMSVLAAVAAEAAENLFVSVISVGEIVKGIALLRESTKKRELHSWAQALERYYSDRILGIDVETTRVWGELTASAQKAGMVVHVSDGLIAATALRHGLHLMTRNVDDFAPSGALIVNPWAGPSAPLPR